MTKLESLARAASKNDSIYTLSLACIDADAKDLLSTEAMDAMEKDPENESLDVVADRLYNEYWTACRGIAAMLVSMTGGMISEKTALHMAIYKRTEIVAIYGKACQQ